MALYLQTLYENAVRSFSTNATDTRFAANFVTAVNFSLDELSRCGHLTAALAHIDATDSNVTGMDEEHSDIMAAGVAYHLMEMGHGMTARNGPALMDRALVRWELKQGDWMIDKSRDDQDDVDDDGNPEADIIGLGYKSE